MKQSTAFVGIDAHKRDLFAAMLIGVAPTPATWQAAIAISLGAVGGRYHYAADAILGWAVALVVWLAV